MLGIEIWGPNNNYTTVEGFKQSNGVTYTLCVNGQGIKDHYNVDYNTGYIVIGPDGVIRYSLTRDFSKFDRATVEPLVDSLLAAISTTEMEISAPKISFHQLTVFPQPARPGSPLHFSQTVLSEIRIFDLKGQLIVKDISPRAPKTAGVYLVSAFSGPRKFTTKLVVTP